MKGWVILIFIVGMTCVVLTAAPDLIRSIPTPDPQAAARRSTERAEDGSRAATQSAGRGATQVAFNLRGIQAAGTLQSAQHTADAFQALQQATLDAARSKTQAAAAYQTQAADERLRAQARQDREATAAVHATERAWTMQRQSWTATADAASSAATATAASASATSAAARLATQEASQATAEARVTDLAYQGRVMAATATAAAISADIRQRQLTNDAWSVARFTLPVIVVLVIVILVSLVVWRRSRYAKFDSGVNGDKPIVLLDGSLIDMDRSVYPVVNPRALQAAPLEQQMRVTAGDQLTDQTRALPRTIVQPGQSPVGFQVIGPTGMPPQHLLPDPGTINTIDGDWTNA